MAGLLYDDYSLQYPGDFRVSEIALVSPYGNVVGITTNVTQLNIYEDIYQNCLTGDITFADTEDVVNECFRIVGVECAFIAHEQRDGQVKVSFRSRGELDVAAVAEQFGGGGHRQASGALFAGPFDDGLARLLETLTAALQ